MFIFNDVIDDHTTAPIEEDYINKEEEEEEGYEDIFSAFLQASTLARFQYLNFALSPRLETGSKHLLTFMVNWQS